MKMMIQKTNKEYSTANAVADNGILAVFRVSDLNAISVSDALEIDLMRLDENQNVENLTSGKSLTVRIQANDVHDLHLPGGHGTSRFPSVERRLGRK
jgi:hypothetical protein